MGGGSTIAAAVAVGYRSIGVEIDPAFFKMAERAIPRLAGFQVNGQAGSRLTAPEEQERLPFLAACDIRAVRGK